MVLHAAAASRDITPALHGDFFGYVRPDLRARGVAGRLQAHALVLDDGIRAVCLVTLDLGAPLVTAGIRARVADLGYGRDDLLIAATHTHAGPNRPGAWVAQQAADAVREAHAERRPARAAWSWARLADANRNRSVEAHLANHGLDLYPGTGTPDLDPDGDEHPRDVTLRLLKVTTHDGSPLAAWAHFSAHPTTIGPANVHFHADYPGAARSHFRAGFAEPPVAIVTNGTEGDLVPRYDEVNQHALADRIGHRVAGAMHRAWDAAGAGSDELTVAGTACTVAYEGQQVAPGARVGRRAWFGLPFLGGAQNGPSWLYGLGLEGRRRPRLLAGAVQGRKLVVAPAPWAPRADVTVVRIGDRLLLSVPGEPTVQAGRRMVAAALEAAGAQVHDALVVAPAQAYRGYFTTPEEYDQQHYEGGHTVFGRYTSLVVQQAHARLAAMLADPPAAADADVAPPPAHATSRQGTAVPPPVGRRGRRGRLHVQPPPRVARFETVRITWTGPRRGRGRPVGTPLVVVERREGARRWVHVDDDLGVGLIWHQRRRRLEATYELPGALPTGTYRLRILGTRTPLVSDSFEAVPSTRLTVVGVSVDGTDLCFHAQNPVPDPARVLRRRDRNAHGGRIRFLADGAHGEARWDADHGVWRATTATRPARVRVPEGGLVDGAGNRSGAAVELVVGAADVGTWPPYLGPGGGRAPGPFGLGSGGTLRTGRGI